MHFKNIIFDLGGVILDINMQKALNGFAALGLPQNELRFDVGETADLMHHYQLGHFATDEFCKLVAAKCNPGTTPEQVANAWNSICIGIPERKLNAIKALKQNANVYLLSNTNAGPLVQRGRQPLRRFLRQGVLKPGPAPRKTRRRNL